MFGQLGQMAGLMKNLPKIQASLAEFQAKLGSLTAEGKAGAGYVTVQVNGHMEVKSVHISDEAMKLNDREMLEDLFTAATNQAIAKVRDLIAAESQKMTASLGLPPGMGLPGMNV